MAITIERNQKIHSLQIIDNIYIYIYFWHFRSFNI